MKMNLKNKQEQKKLNMEKLKKYFNNKNLFIFLCSLLLISIIVGILFYCYMNTNDKLTINKNIESYFQVKESYNYLKDLKLNLLNNFGNNTIIWLLGISIIGIILVIFLFFIESFSIGYSLAAIISNYKLKGIIGIFSYLFPSKIIYIFTLIILTYYSIRFSIDIIRHLIFKKEINFHEIFNKYLKILLFTTLLSILISILEVFIDPLMIKLFTFFTK